MIYIIIFIFIIVIIQSILILIYCLVAVYVASPEAQRRNSLEKQLERLDNDMSLLSKISILADTLTISHMVNTSLFKDHYFHLILNWDSVNSIFVKNVYNRRTCEVFYVFVRC